MMCSAEQDSGLLHPAVPEKVRPPLGLSACNLSSFRIFTLSFRSFSPMPNTMEFQAGQDYFFISTSRPGDVMSREGGYCSSHNMKVIFKVLASPGLLDRGEALESKDQTGTGRSILTSSQPPVTSGPSSVITILTTCLAITSLQ